MNKKTFSLEEFVESQGGKMAPDTNSSNMVTALVRWKRDAGKDETFPRFTTDGRDTFEVDGKTFGDLDQHGEKQIHKNFREFFKNLTAHDYWLVSYRTEDEHHFITQFINMEKRLPADTRHFLETLPTSSRDNFGLFTHKAAAFRGEKFWLLNDHQELNYPFRRQAYQKLLEAINKRHNELMAAFKALHHATFAVQNMQVQGRLVVGLGSESVYETGMTLHPVYGIPYLPGSAIKGVLRNFIIANVEQFRNDKGEADEAKALQDPVFCQIFGCPKESIAEKALRGRVIFFDAFPQETPNIVADVMTPHYQDYYMKDNVPPADWLSPNPVVFLTVERPRFDFFMAIRQIHAGEGSEWERISKIPTTVKEWLNPEGKNKLLSETIKTWLPRALREHGIGAKTAVGYGIFS